RRGGEVVAQEEQPVGRDEALELLEWRALVQRVEHAQRRLGVLLLRGRAGRAIAMGRDEPQCQAGPRAGAAAEQPPSSDRAGEAPGVRQVGRLSHGLSPFYPLAALLPGTDASYR